MGVLKIATLGLVSLALAGSMAVAAGYGSKPVLTGKMGDQVFLMDSSKMTLYTFDKDTRGVSNCYDGCAINWPPLTAGANTSLPAGFGLIKRTDGTMQIAHKGQPLYLWFKDTKPGMMTGDGIKGVWHVARP